MRLYSYLRDEGRPALAAAIDDGPVIDVAKAWALVREGGGVVMGPLLRSAAALVREGPWALEELRAVVAAAADAEETHVELLGARLLPPLAPASLRDFLAFEDHVKRGAERRGADVPAYWYEAPVYYKGNHRSVIGPEDVCPWPPYTEWLDFELELAMIVGKRGRDITPDDAAAHIFGFTIFNDFSARDVQAKELSAWLGPAKSKDFANALGPCIVTVDEVGTEPDLTMACRVNGEEWGRARSSEARWDWAEMIAHVSRGEDVYPGDVFGSGTPGGCCGLDLDRRLEAGDVVELEIERIGVLRNHIGTPERR